MSGFLSDGASVMATVWILAWGIRMRGDLDHRMDTNAKWIRWSIVVVGILVAFGLGPRLNSVVVRGHGMARCYRVSRLAQFRLLFGEPIQAIWRTEVIAGQNTGQTPDQKSINLLISSPSPE